MTDIFFTQDGQKLPIGEIGELYIPASTDPEQHITTTEQAEFSFDITEQIRKIEAMLRAISGKPIMWLLLAIVHEKGHRRIVHLARHGRKARTRKKNKRRAIRLFKEDT